MGHRLRTNLTVVASVAAILLFAAAPAASASKADDVSTARQGVLQTSDFPTGWTGTRLNSPSDATVIKTLAKIPACKDYVAVRKLSAAASKARSLEYGDGSTTTVSNVVNAFGTPAKASAALKIFAKSTVATCLEQYTQKSLGTQGVVKVSPADVTGLGANTVGYTADVADSSGTIQEELLTFAVPVGSFISVYTVEVKSNDAPISTVQDAINSSITRLTTAAG